MTQPSFDLHSLLSWLRQRELEEHLESAKYKHPNMSCHATTEKAFREVIDHIVQQPTELHRCMVPVGWDAIDP